MSDRSPTSTYRLQLQPGFGFAEAAAIVSYLSDLGVSHLYLSPILQAVPGSVHGYDVVDHTRVSDDLGGRDGLTALAGVAHAHGLGIVTDVVPNHMAVPEPEHLNRPLWDTLKLGRASAFAHWFDVDWEHGDGRIGLPLLGGTPEELLAAGELTLGELGGETVVRYADHVFPVAPGTASDDVAAVLGRQHYALASWRDKESALNYRRFFDVDTLIAIRVELDDVFDATHAVLLELYAEGVLDGFRIDHPDGLADPQGYLERLADRTGGAWVVVEDILAPGEPLPPAWPCAGTTGYDATRVIQGALVPPVAPELDERWRATGGEASLERVEAEAKRLVVRSLFEPEVRRLARSAVYAAADAGTELDAGAAEEALRELLAHVDVYRAYLRPGFAADEAECARLERWSAAARGSRPELAEALDLLDPLLRDTLTASAAGRDLIVRFQQVCGPVMAKGIEDTTFYRWHRMIALDEVGGDPRSLDAADAEPLHVWAGEQAERFPLGLTTLSTHDTKRSEDVRARLLALAEDIEGWDAAWEAVRGQSAEYHVDEPTAYLLFQTLLGTWPLELDRLTAYMEKAVNESKEHTSWNDPDARYEVRVGDFAARCLDGDVAQTFARVLAANEATIRAVTLSAKLLQLTLPGIPDVYQGNEILAPALVDPDNRRAVDYAVRAELLAELDARLHVWGQTPNVHAATMVSRDVSDVHVWGLTPNVQAGHASDLDAAKLRVTASALRLRRERPEVFGPGSSYAPLVASSPHALGFVRDGTVATVVTRWPGLLARTGWRDATASLPPGVWNDVLTGASHRGGTIACESLLADLPVALLSREG